MSTPLRSFRTASSPLRKRGDRVFRPTFLGLEERTMMTGGFTAAASLRSSGATATTTTNATSIFLSEAVTLLAGQPLPAGVLARLGRGIERGTLTREGALRQILRTPQVHSATVRSLTEKLLNREPTKAETRALAGGLQRHGADATWALVQIMSKPEYFRAQGSTNASFVRAATSELLDRPAMPDELAKVVPTLDRGGAAARSRFLRSLTRSVEFRLSQTQDVAEQYLGTSFTPEQGASLLQAFRGPLGYTTLIARALNAADDSNGIIPTFAENPGLSVKRVPGFLAGWTVPNLAAPYDVASELGRSIDDKTVDYWAITLNALDSVLLSIQPQNGAQAGDFAVRIWGPDNKEIGKAATGGDFTFVAATVGTYVLGISTKDDAAYAFQPSAAQPTPTGPSLRSFNADFQTYPGTNTNTIQLLLNYKNPAYIYNNAKDLNNWPKFSDAEQNAYATLVAVASAAHTAGVPGYETFEGDFRTLKVVTDTNVISGWLDKTWAPFQAVLTATNPIQEITDLYDRRAFPQINAAYTLAQWTTVATPFINDAATRQAFQSVSSLIATADDARAQIANDFLSKFEAWSTSNEIFLGQDATDVAALMKSGLSEVPQMPKPVDQKSWIERLLAGIVTFAASAAGAISGVLEPGSGPFVSLGVSTVGNLIVNCIDAWLDGDFGNKKPPPPPPSRLDITGAAIDMQTTALNTYKSTFDLLTNQGFLTSLFSNYGLLEAMQAIQFTYAPGDKITPAAVLKQNYDLSIWEQLLPQMFSWKLNSFNDPASTVPNFTNFIPIDETATWQSAQGIPPLKPPTSNWYSWDWVTHTWSRPAAVADVEARSELTSLQNGKPFQFLGHDFTPGDWFGPGPISGPQQLTGDPGRFYAIATNAHLSQNYIWRELAGIDFDTGGEVGQWWKGSSTINGISIQEWALVTPDGKGGYLELSPAAATALFGAIPAGGLVATSPDFKSYTGGQYLDFQIPPGGVTTRFDVFANWGKGFKDFSPYSFQPPKLNGSNQIGLNPNNQNSAPWFHDQKFYNQYADFSLTYGSTRTQRVSRISGEAPGPVPNRINAAAMPRRFPGGMARMALS